MSKEDRLNETISFIRQAIQSCGDDFATLTVRANLLVALREAGYVSKKRARRERNAMQEAAVKAQNLHNEWWKQIEENVRAAAKESADRQAINLNLDTES